MARIAHITDLHLVEETYQQRSSADRMRLSFLNTGRSIDPAQRRAQALSALRTARDCDHVLLTGDLTEDGVPAQFELLAEVLHEAGVDPARVTLVAGNHDLYSDPLAVVRALQGPLRPYAATSRPDRLLEVGCALLLPIETAVQKPVTRSSGVFRPEHAQAIDIIATAAKLRGRPLLVAQHHPPLGHRNPLWNFIDGLENADAFAQLLKAHPGLHVAHGHNHHHGSSAIDSERADQVHSAAAIFDDPQHMRIYHAAHGELRAIPASPSAPPRRPALGAQPELASFGA